MSIRLSGYDRKKIAAQIKADINAYCAAIYDKGYRDHLGASVIGELCNRKLVYAFRHMHREQFDGRMQRLFNRGQLEENRVIEWLRGILATVWANDKDGNQFTISARENHYGGSLDGQIRLPDRYRIQDTFLLEIKTHNDKSFNKLVNIGVKAHKPIHYNQMCVYGEAMQFDYALYFAVNKNDDDIWPEIVEIDHKLGKHLRDTKAAQVISAYHLPPRIAASPAYEECKYCSMSGVCHSNEPVDVNCRSCANSKPGPNATWYCEYWCDTIPKEAIPEACPQWRRFE